VLPAANDYPFASDNTQGRAQEPRTSNTKTPNPFYNTGANGNNDEPDFSWEMIGLGLEEPLPPQDVMDDL